ncbi:unnamed protein product [Cercopithifilaria johnstoni]|uniref:Uncharacterized protein n=1 Tax=Cercopithifilaria johnstoni TaxID=2874296 RepID=A0A8J2QA90_9BILA|nr:unnamed protein product [Cercopithifilaria johnstoni]
MAIIILPWYIYFIIRRSWIQAKAAINIKYTLLDFERIHPGEKVEGWQEIPNVTSVSIKDEEIDKKPSSSRYDTNSKTVSNASSQATESSRSKGDDGELTTRSITGNKSNEYLKTNRLQHSDNTFCLKYK